MNVESLLQTGGAWSLAGLMLVENLFPPIPSEVVLPLAGFLVGRGRMGLVVALAAATAGSVVGALVLYGIGRYGGRPLVLRLRPLLRLSEQDLDRADDWFDRHGHWVVLFGRMVPLARSVVSVPAGASEMPLARFTLLTAAGSLTWNAVLIGAGIALGDNWQRVAALGQQFSTMVLWAAVALAATAAVWWWRRTAPSQR